MLLMTGVRRRFCRIGVSLDVEELIGRRGRSQTTFTNEFQDEIPAGFK